jgi:hypothetical protein
MEKQGWISKAVEDITKDLCDRQGGDEFWCDIESDIQGEIMEAWKAIILKGMVEWITGEAANA